MEPAQPVTSARKWFGPPGNRWPPGQRALLRLGVGPRLVPRARADRQADPGPRAKSLAGAASNCLPAPLLSVATTPSAPVPNGYDCPCSIWTAASAPAFASSDDRGAVELGVRFRSEV